jgi:aldehyde oxidoreductase
MKCVKIELTVNGKQYIRDVAPAMRLADFLRDELHLIGVKIGCCAGECGACSVLIDGIIKKSCLIPVIQVNHKHIITIEGLGIRGLDIIQKSFIKAGAVQCGYCTPGMIMAATSLLKHNPYPDVTEIRKALSGNICRCTGYAKIIEAIELARDVINHVKPIECLDPVSVSSGHIIGSNIERVDARGKVTGRTEYAGDMVMPGMLHIHLVRSKEVHAEILNIDYSEALNIPGVEAVITSKDVPGEDGFGVFFNDQPVLAKDKVRFFGEPIAAIVADSLEIAEEAEKYISISYKKLPIISTIKEAVESKTIIHSDHPDNVVSTAKVIRGDVKHGFASSDYVFEKDYSTQAIEHAYLETEAGIAYVDPNGALVVESCDQDLTQHRMLLSKILNLPISKIRVIQTPTGGGFGGKEDMIYQGILSIAALITQKPVKLVFSRTESMIGSSKRHPVCIHNKIGINKDGKIQALEVSMQSDGGAYCFSTKGTVIKSVICAAGPYDIANIKVTATGYYTNNTPSGAMRCFGVLQPTFALESTIDMCSEMLGIDPIELRHINGFKDGAFTHTGQPLGKVAYDEVLDRCAEIAKWQPGPSSVRGEFRNDIIKKDIFNPYIPGYEFKPFQALKHIHSNFRYGRGVGSSFYGIGRCGSVDRAAAYAEIDDGGTVKILTGVTEIGEGILTVLTQIAADELGVYPEDVVIGDNDTARSPEAAHAGASRQTYLIGNAVLNACKNVKEKFINKIADYWDVDASNIVMKNRKIYVKKNQYYSLSISDAVDVLKKQLGYVPIGCGTFTAHSAPLDPRDGSGHPWQTYVFGTQIAEVAVDISTGEVYVLGIWSSHDVGRAINPLGIAAQIEGGSTQALGQALMENYSLSNGIPQTKNFSKYIVPTSVDVPKYHVALVENKDPFSPLGAKGVSEPAPLNTAPAIINAIYDAVGVRITDLPATPDKILVGMKKKAQEGGN